MKHLVAAIEYKPNCPVCDGSNYNGEMKGFDSEEKLFNFIFEYMNSYKVIGVYDVFDEQDNIYEIRYIPELHSIRDIEIYKDGRLIRRTIDNGSGIKVWGIINE